MGFLRQMPNKRGGLTPIDRDPFFSPFDDMFQQMWNRWPAVTTADKREWEFFPHIEVSQKEDKIKICAELPGMDHDDVTLHLERDHLVIEGEKKFETNEDKDGRTYSERRYGHFRREVTLPFEVDQEKVEAKFKKGILNVELLRAQDAKSRTRKIPIS
jgi:HSP20 family protein